MAKYTESKKRNNLKWDSANLERVSIALKKGQKARIKAAADAAHESMNQYIIGAIDRRIDAELPLSEDLQGSDKEPADR